MNNMKIISIAFLTVLMAFAVSTHAQEKKVVMNAEDVTISAGGQADLVINMDYETAVPVVGWNIYLSLPEGVDLYFDDEEEDYVYEVSSALHKKALRNGFGIKKVADKERCYMLYCIDQKNTPPIPMTATQGQLLSITLTATAEASEECSGTLYDIALTDAENKSLDLGNIADYVFAIKVEGGVTTGIRDINTAAGAATVYNLSGQRVENPARGLFIKNGKKFLVK